MPRLRRTHDIEDRSSGIWSVLTAELGLDKETPISDKMIVLGEIIARCHLKGSAIDERFSELDKDIQSEGKVESTGTGSHASGENARRFDDLLRLTDRFLRMKEDNRPSDDDLLMRVQHVFFGSTAFKAAVGLALLGAVLIGLVSVTSSWINFTAADTVQKTQAELTKTQGELARTQQNAADLNNKYLDSKEKYSDLQNQLSQFNTKVTEEISEQKESFKKVLSQYEVEVKTATDSATKAADRASASVPGIVADIVAKQQKDLEARLVAEQEDAVTRFHAMIIELVDNRTAESKAKLNETTNPPGSQHFNGGVLTWINQLWTSQFVVYASSIAAALVLLVFLFFVARRGLNSLRSVSERLAVWRPLRWRRSKT
jgi:hypothetical protein